MLTYRLFWYHVLTCVSVKLNFAANSILSCTDKYFCLSKLFSNVCSWRSVNAVLAFLCFLLSELPDPFEEFNDSSPVCPAKKKNKSKTEARGGWWTKWLRLLGIVNGAAVKRRVILECQFRSRRHFANTDLRWRKWRLCLKFLVNSLRCLWSFRIVFYLWEFGLINTRSLPVMFVNENHFAMYRCRKFSVEHDGIDQVRVYGKICAISSSSTRNDFFKYKPCCPCTFNFLSVFQIFGNIFLPLPTGKNKYDTPDLNHL